MKLYTEDQLKKAIKLAQKCEHDCGGVYFEYEIEDVLEDLTPIELPSDEEIHKSSPHQISDSNNSWDIGFHNGWKQGAKWMRDKIQGGNNEQQ